MKIDTSSNIRKLIYSALFLALAMVLPFLTGQIQQFGQMLCPMHIPVMLCGFLCGWQWGLAVGAVSPLLRSLIVGMPPLYPIGVCMAFELAVYGLLCGLLYKKLKTGKFTVYSSLIISMLGGRVVWGAARFICSGLDASKFGFSAFISGAFTTAIPGIIVQLIVIPPIVMLIERGRAQKAATNNV